MAGIAPPQHITSRQSNPRDRIRTSRTVRPRCGRWPRPGSPSRIGIRFPAICPVHLYISLAAIASQAHQQRWNEICVYTGHIDRGVSAVSAGRSARQQLPIGRWRTMHIHPRGWLHTVILFSTVLCPVSAIESSANPLLTEPPAITPDSAPQAPLRQTQSRSLSASTTHTRTARAVPGRSIKFAPASYTLDHPRIVRPRPLVPAFDENWQREPQAFIGPRQPSTFAVPALVPDIAGVRATTPRFSLSPNNQPIPAIMSMPHLGNEYEHMNDASHVILHGGN